MKCNYRLMSNKDVEKAKEHATNEVFELMLAIPVTVLHDYFGWGKKRCTDFIEKVFYKYDSYQRGYVTIEELRETLWEESGVKVENKKTNSRNN